MGQGRGGAPRPGWFDDPARLARLRYWTGSAWAGWVSDGDAVWLDPMPRRALRSADLAHLAFVEEVFLPEALSRKVIPADLAPALATVLEQLRAEAQGVPAPASSPRPAAPTATQPPSSGAASPARAATTTPAQAPSPASVPLAGDRVSVGPSPETITRLERPSQVPTVASGPGPVARWWARSRDAIGSDLAVHGLAYLGVLLFFVGAFGLVAFAFGEVASGLRPVAELVIAVVPFVTGALLRRRGAVVVGRSLEVLGGLLLPIMAITTLVDGVGFPPDLDGTALVVAATAASALVTIAYVVWSRRDADSALHHVVAPAAWFAVGMGALGLAREVPTGKGVATPSAAQAAAMLTALAVSVAWGRFRPQARLARPTLSAAVIGLPVLALMALLAAAAEGWPSIPVLLSGAAVLAALHLLRGSVPSGAVDVTGPLWWAIVWAALSAGPLSTAGVAAVAAVGFVVLLELGGAASRAGEQSPNAAFGGELTGAPVCSTNNAAFGEGVRLEGSEPVVPGQVEVHPSDLGLVLCGIGAAAALLAAWPDPRWASAALALGAVWAAIRRAEPFSTSHDTAAAGGLLDAVAALLPVFALAALARATSPAVAVVTAAGVVAAVTALAVRPWLRREPEDRYWMRWWQLGVPAVVLAALLVWQPTLTTGERWATTTTLALLAAATTVGPVPRPWRPVVLALLGLATWLTAAATLGLGDLVRIGLPALVGFALVLLVHLTTWRARVDAGSLALTGHGLTAAAVGMAFSAAPWVPGSVAFPHDQLGWTLVGALAAATTGLAVTGWCDVLGRSPVGALLAGDGWTLRWAPLALAAAGLPVTASVLLDVSGVLLLADPWAVAVPAVAAVSYAVGSRFRPPVRVGPTLSWGAFVAGLVAVVSPLVISAPGQAGPLPGVTPPVLSVAERAPAIAGLASLIIAVLLVRPDQRRPVMSWTAWAAAIPLAGLGTAQAWQGFAALPAATATALTLVAVGGLMLVGAVAADLRGRPWKPRRIPSRRSLVPPAGTGALGIAVGLVTALVALPPQRAGWAVMIAAVALLATALCCRAGVLAGASALLGWLAALLLVGPQIVERPWMATLSALTLLLAAEAFSASKSWSPRSPQWARWDLPLLVAAAPVGASGPILAAGGAWSGAMLAALGAEALAVAVRLRGAPVVAVPLGAVGAGLLLVGASSEGAGWLALALLGLALFASGIALFVGPPARLALQVAGAVCGVGAWRALTTWLGWSDQQSVDVAALWGAGLAIGLAGVARLGRVGAVDHPTSDAATPEPGGPGRSWLLTWGGAALAVVSITAWDALTTAPVLRSTVGPSWWITVGLLVSAMALAVAARPVQVAWLREAAAVHGLAALVVGARTADASPAQRVLVLGLVSAAAAAVLLTQTAAAAPTAGGTPPRNSAGTRLVWLRPLIVLGAGSALWSVGTATLALTSSVAAPPAALTGPLLLVGPLVAVALQFAAIGVCLRQFWLQALAAPVLCVAWVVFADAALGSDPQWATVPIGLTILIVVALWRRDRHRRDERLDIIEVVVPELVGIGFLVGAFFIEAVTESLWQAVSAAALGMTITAWGVLTRVRRRLLAGSAVAGAALVVLVGAPLVRLLPTWEGAALWVLIAALGLTAVVAATLLEHGKVVTRKGVARFGALTAGWE